MATDDIPVTPEESNEDCDPETGTKTASQDEVKSFKERIEEETQEREKPENIEKELELARRRVVTMAMPWLSPVKIIVGYCALVMIATLLAVWLIVYAVGALLYAVTGIDVGVTTPVIVAVISSIGALPIFLTSQIDKLFVQVGSGEAGVLRWFGTPVHRVKDGKNDYEPFPTGLMAAPRPIYTGDTYKQDQKTFEIKPHTIPVQSLTVECDPKGDNEAGAHTNVMEPDDENQGSTVEFKGKFTIAPDDRDFRSLILFYDFTEGMDKVGARIEEAIARAVQFYFSGPEGPANQAQALGIGEYVFRILKALIVVDLATSGVEMLSLSPDLKPPKDQLDAVAQANTQKAEQVRDRRNAMSFAETMAIIKTGNENIDSAGIQAALGNMNFDADNLAFLAGRANKTLSENDKTPLKKIITNDPTASLFVKGKELLLGEGEGNG